MYRGGPQSLFFHHSEVAAIPVLNHWSSFFYTAAPPHRTGWFEFSALLGTQANAYVELTLTFIRRHAKQPLLYLDRGVIVSFLCSH